MVRMHYDQTPEMTFFLCRQCRTHIALTQELRFIDPECNFGIFNNLVNVEVSDEAHHQVEGPFILADVSCTGCPWFFADKFIEVEQEDEIFKRGRFGVSMEMLLLWDGFRMLYADTLEPVEDA